ncbi:MAG TPA: RDD family protein [Acetobacteraceae bacterium]|nr:RDD family protein [Acetobacteraceae bacterium]
MPVPDDDLLTQGVVTRRVFAWFLDLLLLALIMLVLWLALMLFGLLTLGLGFPMLGLLPFVPFCYNVLFLAAPSSATPGQRMLGLLVRRNDDLGRPTALQAVISTIVFYLTFAPPLDLLLLIVLVTVRRRALHDLASGLVVVRTEAVQPLTPPFGYGNIQGGSPYA